MNYFLKESVTTICCSAIWTNQLLAYLPPISFESPVYIPGEVLGLSNGTGWSLLSGNAAISANGQGVGGGQALKIEANAAQEPLLVRDINSWGQKTCKFYLAKMACPVMTSAKPYRVNLLAS